MSVLDFFERNCIVKISCIDRVNGNDRIGSQVVAVGEIIFIKLAGLITCVVKDFFSAAKSGWSSNELRHEPKEGERKGKPIFKKGHQFRKRHLHKYNDELGYGQEVQDYAHIYGMTKTGKLPKTKLEMRVHTLLPIALK